MNKPKDSLNGTACRVVACILMVTVGTVNVILGRLLLIYIFSLITGLDRSIFIETRYFWPIILGLFISAFLISLKSVFKHRGKKEVDLVAAEGVFDMGVSSMITIMIILDMLCRNCTLDYMGGVEIVQKIYQLAIAVFGIILMGLYLWLMAWHCYGRSSRKRRG